MEVGKDANGVKALSRYALEHMVTRSSEGMILVDARDERLPIIYANPAYEELTGFTVAELGGRRWPLAAEMGATDAELERLQAAIRRSEPCEATIPDVAKDGRVWASRVSVEPLYNARGELKYFLCIQRRADTMTGESGSTNGTRAGSSATNGEAEAAALTNGDAAAATLAAQASALDCDPMDTENGQAGGVLTDMSSCLRDFGRARPKVASLDRIDPATGLLRLHYFEDTLRRDLAQARRDRRPIAVLVVEIPDLDVYRQTFGAKAAESCQRMVGAQMTRALRRAGDLCARFDDTALIAATLGQEPSQLRPIAEQIAENVRRLGLHNPRARSGRYVAVRTAVLGLPPGADEELVELVKRARAALEDAAGSSVVVAAESVGFS